MAVITLSREFGSGAESLYQTVAQSLNYTVYDKDVIGEVLSKYGLISFDKVYETPHSFWSRFQSQNEETIYMLNNVIRAFAKRDHCLIIGRGAFMVLQGYSNVLNVCIRGSFAQRVSNIMKERKIKDSVEAENLVKYNDNIRRSFLQTFYGVTSEEVGWFNLMIDVDSIPCETAGRWIVEACRLLENKCSKLKGGTPDIEVDSVLQRTIQEVLADRSGTGDAR